MCTLAMEVCDIAKRYNLGVIGSASLRETLSEWGGSLWKRKSEERPQEFWALKGVSFELGVGEVLGIIGRNGAGKSTLLKVLSRITEPTSGKALIHGRVASLLEVGTGFHPELTGRENIFLNGSILGMTRREISKKFDDIVEFSGVEKFVDTPVKRYSSGMYVRLAFSVAAHLEPEILIIDEVLSVGDAEFQKKCLGKMDDAASEGRTILFVSHTMTAVQKLCDRVIYLKDGRVALDGKPVEVIAEYLNSNVADGSQAGDGKVDVSNAHRTRGSDNAIKHVWIENDDGEIVTTIMLGEPATFCFEFCCKGKVLDPGLGFGIETVHGMRVFSFNNYISQDRSYAPTASGVAAFRIPRIMLLPDRYNVSVSVVQSQTEWIDYVEQAMSFDVEANDIYGTGKLLSRSQGLVHVEGDLVLRTP